MASIVKGLGYNYGDNSTFNNRIVDNTDGNGLSPIDNFISPTSKEFIFKNQDIESRVRVDFINLDNLWHYPNKVLKSIKNVNK
jgi:hypothetical protein